MDFNDAIYTVKSTVQIETHHRTCCKKRKLKPRNKSKPKHLVKVHVWVEISCSGRTKLCIFEGKMNASLFAPILNNSAIHEGLLPRWSSRSSG